MDQLLDIMAAPYAYETGFYFLGKKTYRIRLCGFCTICAICWMVISFFVLFSPVWAGSIVFSELETTIFNTPADIPDDPSNHEVSKLSKFFGRRIGHDKPNVNMTSFLEQYPTITVYGGNLCDDGSPIKNFFCSAVNS